MQYTFQLLATASILAVAVSAAPAATSTACHPLVTYRPTFDTFKVGDKPAKGFEGASWNGLTVTAPSPYTLLKPASGNNTLVTSNPFNSFLTTTTNTMFEIESFFFGCIAPIPGPNDLTPNAVPCNITVIGSANDYAIGIVNLGNYNFTMDYNMVVATSQAPMQKVQLNAVSSSFHFVVTEAPKGTQLYLDSFVIIQTNTTCMTDTSDANIVKTLQSGPQNL